MKRSIQALMAILVTAIPAGVLLADSYDDTLNLFKQAGQSAGFFETSYAYAVFPTIGKAGLGIGAAHGTGRVYEHGKYVGDTTVTQVSFGLQAGGQAYSQVIFLQDKRAFDEFTSGAFGLDASAGAVAITSAVSGTAGTSGASAGASGGKNDAVTAGQYHKGLAIFTIVKGGAMFQASVAGQKFSYKRL
jgi:lipid-binding SYLF domain-containing protein